ncbi:aminopeptidase P family N-terminal domain-containing protein [Naasia aerilata]|uniref:Creatinase N-terminal domain-containing protein n=1 Tax=Naasia aerilata TaxID=1162966 RepID=A0ABN6XLK4_9MICO|nr:aminopeptidase P family N-terminal domain-containing protein [Naasia aerilata]BDZ45048.1 hypothetical protein GCM10025866_09570 [Naasia aerilata]
MKRGLVVLDPAEIAESEWADRIATVQQRLKAEGVDVGIVYNDVSRGDDIGYLTNLVIYWNEGVLAIPAEGEATLLTKLSKRVFSWMQRTSMLEDLRSGPSFGKLVASYVAGRPAGTIGVIDAALWPAAVVAEIEAAVPDWTVKPLGSLVRDVRAQPSEAEVALLRAGVAALRAALADATVAGLSMRERLAAVDRVTRHAGFADALVRGAEDGGHVTMEVAGEYRHGWLLAGRTFGDEPWLPLLADAQRAAFVEVRAGAAFSAAEAAATIALQALPEGSVTSIRWINQADFATGGELQPVADAPAAGEVGAVVIEVIDVAGVRSVLTDTVLVTAEGADPLTAARSTDSSDQENNGI